MGAPSPPVTRYAPSPTGPLHLGHVAHMLYVWGLARRFGARILLRIEDHDSGRCRPEYEAGAVEDLDWLGFHYDNVLHHPSPYRQSDSAAAYYEALEKLSRAGLVYRCDCSRKRIAETAPLGPGGERRYSGFCRDRQVPADRPHGLRVRLEPGEERFVDGFLGPQSQDPESQCGDLLIRDRAEDWTYQFAVVVDDLRHGVDLIVRGEDLLPSTGRQIRLARLLGRPDPPRFFHHPLIVDERGMKLSKKTAAGPLADERKRGRSPQEILGEAAFRVGLAPTAAPLELDAALALVELSRADAR
ncbi:MAG: hypothetical protein GC160_25655 [Acidobacteria bacterium]|nr:hypothetical protein [Acidobacteriota bacterium]